MRTKLAVRQERRVGNVKLWDVFGSQTPLHLSLSTHPDDEQHLQSEPNFNIVTDPGWLMNYRRWDE